MMMQMLVHQMTFILLLSICRASTAAPQTAKPGCPETCGNVIIPYPFGIGPNESCYYDEWFQIDCNKSTEGKPFLRRTKLEVRNISTDGRLQVYSPVTFFCEGINRSQATDLTDSPFVYSQSDNIFTAVSCNFFTLLSSADFIVGGCRSVCDQSYEYLGCDIGNNCCQTSIPPYLTIMYADVLLENNTSYPDLHCNKFAFLVDKNWFQYRTNSTPTISDMKSMRKVPVTLDWSINNHTGPFDFDTSIVNFVNESTENNEFNRYRDYLYSRDPSCIVYPSRAFSWSLIYCYCPSGYEGNPYLGLYSCHDIDECHDSHHPPCGNSKCVNEYGSHRCEDDRRKAKLILATAPVYPIGPILKQSALCVISKFPVKFQVSCV